MKAPSQPSLKSAGPRVRLQPAALAAAALLLAPAFPARAAILAPYTPDEHTLHLWHFNEADAPVLDAVTNGLDLAALGNGATLGSESYQGAKGFGTALCTYTGNPSQAPGSAGQDAYLAAQPLQNGMADNVALHYAGAEGAFTYEAVVRIDFDPTANFGADGWGQGRNLFMQVLNADADENAHRLFQLRLAPIGTLNGNPQPLVEFINLNKAATIQSLTAPIPTEGPDAIRAGSWYHLAVAYNGQADQADNLRFYWTLLDARRTAAHEIGTGQMTYNLPTGCEPDFAIGQTGRQSPVTTTPNNNFVGLIDEVRLSSVARGATQMLFGERILAAKPATRTTPATTASAKPAVAAEPAPASTPPAKPAVAAEPPPAKPAVAAEPAPAVAQPLPVAAAAPAPSTATVSPAATPAPAAAAPAKVEWPKKSGSPIPILAEGAVVRGPADRPRLALVFSCRAIDENTPGLLAALKANQAKASFFVSSDFLNWPLNLRQVHTMVVDGHLVGPQADGWVSLTKDRSRSARSPLHKRYPEVAAHLEQFTQLGLDRKACRFFLPTRDQINSATAQRAGECGLTMIAGTSGTLSTAAASVEGSRGFASSQAILESILTREQQDPSGLNGYMLLFQLDSGARGSDKFQARFGELLQALRQRGYEFVRVDELLNGLPQSSTLTSQPQ